MGEYFKDRVSASDQPQNNLEGMIDIETFGTVAGSPVITIGAVLFDPYASDSSQAMLDRSINIRIDLSDSIRLSRGVSGGTIRWWFEQKDEAIKALVGNDAVSAQEALTKLWRFCRERGTFVNKEFFNDLSELPQACRFWAKDPDFDMQILQYYYDHSDISAKAPWEYHQCRSVRTIQDLAWPEGAIERPTFKVPGVAHDARWDAVQQAMTVQAAMRRLGLAKDQDVKFAKYEPPTQ